MGQPGNPDDLTVDLRAAARTGRLPHAATSGLPVSPRPEPDDDSKDLAVEVAPRPSEAAVDVPPRKVSGKVYDELGAAMPGLEILVYHIGFNCDSERLGGTVTGGDGSYSVEYRRDGVVNLQVRAASARGAEFSLSTVVYRAGRTEVLNLVCPASVRPAASEYARMRADLVALLGRGKLADASEGGECHDITMLSRATGWDGRLVALAAHAERLSDQTGAPAPALYSLLRAGLPFDSRMLADLPQSTLASAFQAAAKAGIADLSEAELAATKKALGAYAREVRLGSVAAPGTLSTVGELLAASGLNADEQAAFDAILSEHDGDAAALWDRARAAGIPPDKIANLRLQGKLAKLTGNNAPLMSTLVQQAGQDGLAKSFMARDFHNPQAWQAYLTRVGAPVPPAYTGPTDQERLALYAEDLARRVRVDLPTHVIARRVETGEFDLPAMADVAKVLYRAADETGFRFGRTATRTFFHQNPQLLQGVADPDATVKTLSAMHRVYQITPSDQAMKAMMDKGFTAANTVTAMDKHSFIEAVADKVDKAVAELIYNKAVLVSSTVYNAFAAAQAQAATPVVYAVSPPTGVAQDSQDNIAKHFPTLEGLFGEMDFCECDHCRSVLSPAAYLVDLLSFVDPKDEVWAAIRKTPTEPKPFDILVQRRPDLPELPLTCENTHTVLPYIDVVNEILEFSVAHDGEVLPAFDVGLADSEDLVAEPQNLISAAYPVLKDAKYPLGLPFDLDLETVRAFLDQLGAPLATVLAELCPTSALDGVPYGWREVFRQQLGLSPAEHALFLNGTTGWHLLYGYPDAATALTQLAKAKTLARRLSVSYQDLADLVQTRFVNPDLDALALLYSLGLSAWDLMRYVNASEVPPFDAAETAAFEQKAGAHLSWLLNSYNSGVFDHITVLADSDPSCSFDHTTIRFLKSADPITEVLTRINLLERLRRRLGWPLSEVDAALRALAPIANLGDSLKAALVSLAHLKALADQVKVGKDTRIALLSLWSTMDRARYQKLFLSPRMRPDDKAVFDDPHGNYLSDPAILLKDHLAAVQGALNLTADDIRLILGTGYDSAPLSMVTVTLLDRHRVLSRGLKLTVEDLIALAAITGVDPFASTSDTLRFVELAGRLKRAGFKVAQLDYLLRGHVDPTGPLAPQRDKVRALIRAVAAEIGRIRAEHAVPTDGLAFTDEAIGSKLPLVLPADVAAAFLGMWAGTTAPDQSFFNANLVVPVGFAQQSDFAWLFPSPPADPNDTEAAQELQRARRAYLATLFLPFLQDRLIRTTITQAVAGEFGIDSELAAALLTELLQLGGEPPLDAFAAADTRGFTVSYLDNGGSVLGTGLSADGGAAAGPAGTASVRLAGLFEVPSPGPYTYAAPAGSVLELRHLTDPLVSGVDGLFPPVALEAGKIYELGLTMPAAGATTLRLIGENLPLGSAGRLTLRPSATVARIEAAHELIHRALLLVDVLDLSLIELRHLGTAAADFASWNLSDPAFEPLVRVCGLALLRQELRLSGEDIVGVFRAARRAPAPGETPADVRLALLELLATLTRRPRETISDAAGVLGFADAEDLADERALTRLWRLLALAKTLGVTPSSVKKWANPVPGEELVADMRTTLKARFESSAWRATVKPVSDRLRQLRRDALVRYLMHRDGFETLERLFEHFLVDPGTEPVVQTSRLRLAISSMQTFIQRCLMNLEEDVRPGALSSTQWEWMKRYRVWEANRKIFLWPENWLEPEFRDDKTHLFQALEGELLQGDVSQDLAEDALNKYLSGLDKVARLDIVSTWLQEHDTGPMHNILHVIGRTFNKPNEYFYRRYQHGAWTPWEPIAAQIESEHVVVTVWRGRPYLFWLTFVARSELVEGEVQVDMDNPTPTTPPRLVDVQLSWAEYVNGAWAPAEASDLNRTLTAVVGPGFDAAKVFAHAETHLTDEEDQVCIFLSLGGDKHQPAQQGNKTKSPVPMKSVKDGSAGGISQVVGELDGSFPAHVGTSIYRGFRLVGRNAPVEILDHTHTPMSPPFTWNAVHATKYQGNGALTAWYTSKIEQFQGETTETKEPKPVLAKVNGFSLVIPPGPVNTTGRPEIDGLVRPFFYQDSKHTFYVEPTVREDVWHEWEDWIVTAPTGPKWEFEVPLYWEEVIPIDPSGPVINPPESISPYAKYSVKSGLAGQGALLGTGVTVQFGDSLIGAEGAING